MLSVLRPLSTYPSGRDGKLLVFRGELEILIVYWAHAPYSSVCAQAVEYQGGWWEIVGDVTICCMECFLTDIVWSCQHMLMKNRKIFAWSYCLYIFCRCCVTFWLCHQDRSPSPSCIGTPSGGVSRLPSRTSNHTPNLFTSLHLQLYTLANTIICSFFCTL